MFGSSGENPEVIFRDGNEGPRPLCVHATLGSQSTCS